MMPANSNSSVNSLCGVSKVVATVAATKEGADGGGRLGSQRLRRIETCPYYRTMTMHHHHHHRPFTSSSLSSGISDDGGGPPIRGDVYHDAAIALDRGGRNMAATALGMFPFTGDQLKELQRQAIIYKYMMAALPVPPRLLFPGLLLPEDLSPLPPTAASTSSSHHAGMKGSSILSFGFESLDKGGTDPEPWRCKRTDGKKWRCSKDVTPNQKYCDRHMHRGRARSRKPVELNTPPPSAVVLLPPIPDRSHPKSSPFEFPNALAPAPFSSGSYKDYTTSLDWVMKQGAANIFDQRSSFFDKRGDSIFNGFQDFVKQRQREECGLFLNLDPLATERPLSERGFIDAWSDSIPEESAADKSQSRMSPLSNLTLSIAMADGGGGIIDQDMGPMHIGFGVGDMDRSKNASGWRSPGSWAAPTPGGPLAEALKRPVSVARGATAADRCRESGSQPTAASSPSGVLHRGVGSVSDSSDSSSPYLAAMTETKHDEVLPSRG